MNERERPMTRDEFARASLQKLRRYLAGLPGTARVRLIAAGAVAVTFRSDVALYFSNVALCGPTQRSEQIEDSVVTLPAVLQLQQKQHDILIANRPTKN